MTVFCVSALIAIDLFHAIHCILFAVYYMHRLICMLLYVLNQKHCIPFFVFHALYFTCCSMHLILILCISFYSYYCMHINLYVECIHLHTSKCMQCILCILFHASCPIHHSNMNLELCKVLYASCSLNLILSI